MALRLRVIGAPAARLGDSDTKLFGVHGGTVGRADDNDWVLPDPERFISGHHARIDYRDGKYWLADTSSNGTFVNQNEEPVAQQGPYVLKDGDRLHMGEYEISVTIEANNDFPPDKSAIVAFDGVASTSAIRHSTENHLAEDDFDISSLFSTDESNNAPVTPVNAWGMAVDSAAVSSRPAAKPPEPKPQAEQASWHMATRRVEPYRNPLKRSEAASLAESGPVNTAGIHALCRGAGIDPTSLPAAVQAQALHLAGQLLREMVLGLMDVLQSREEVKGRFRITDSGEQAQPPEYNPLQSSTAVDEALCKLFEAYGKSSSRYLTPVDAVRETFHDLKVHQQAMMTAMQSAFAEFFSRLDPKELRERFDRGLKRGGLLGASNKTKYWELYGEFYQTLTQKDELPHLFVEEFAQAYSAKISQSGSARARAGRKIS